MNQVKAFILPLHAKSAVTPVQISTIPKCKDVTRSNTIRLTLLPEELAEILLSEEFLVERPHPILYQVPER